MTIRDLMEQGVYLQGCIKVLKWDSDMENSEQIDCSHNTNGEGISEEVLDLEINYIYAEDNDLIVEVIGKEN